MHKNSIVDEKNLFFLFCSMKISIEMMKSKRIFSGVIENRFVFFFTIQHYTSFVSPVCLAQTKNFSTMAANNSLHSLTFIWSWLYMGTSCILFIQPFICMHIHCSRFTFVFAFGSGRCCCCYCCCIWIACHRNRMFFILLAPRHHYSKWIRDERKLRSTEKGNYECWFCISACCCMWIARATFHFQ